MFVFNLSVNKNKISKIILICACILVAFILIFACIKIFSKNSSFKINDKIVAPDVVELTAGNYTNVLKSVHEDLDSYIGQSISFSGYVYRLYDFSNEQFVLARNMMVSSDFQSVVVGFLCSHDDAINFEDNAWVEIEGKITKGDYHGEIPIIKVEKIKRIEKPNDEYVYPPDDAFVETSTIL